MKDLEKHTLETKHAWASGPWTAEPDRVQWTDQQSGLKCLADRNSFFGTWNGYVAIDDGHPLYAMEKDDTVPMTERVRGRNWNLHRLPAPELISYAMSDNHDRITISLLLNIHCGLSYSGWLDGAFELEPVETDKLWGFGFDCNHGQDLAPSRVAEFAHIPLLRDFQVYRDLSYVRAECTLLAAQLGDIRTLLPHLK